MRFNGDAVHLIDALRWFDPRCNILCSHGLRRTPPADSASLALALGLADLIQAESGGIQLDTMFVDEGFGSLDEESLRMAMNTLASLSDGRRLVGIISHVAELKERIDKQIIVTKSRDGYSSARIVLE